MLKLFLALCFVAGAAWTENPNLRNSADDRTWTKVPKFQLDLDLPAKDRWTKIGALYKDKAPALIDYLATMIPRWAIPIIEAIAADIEPFFREYGDEMVGLADAMGLKIGDVVTLNLVYQLESIGLNCSNWNNTGPTVPDDPGCIAVDPKQAWCYCKDADANGILRKEVARDVPGLCTSVVAQDNNNQIWHGRNLDWNLPDVLLEMAIDVDYVRNGSTLFSGTTIVGFVGLLNAIRSEHGVGYSASIDARGKGGKIIENLLEALLAGKAMTPSQHLRHVFENQRTYPQALDAFSTGALVNEVYYIVAGSSTGEGVVISRDRNNGGLFHNADQWPLDTSAQDGWFRLQTNYDHWNPAPVADDRRNPGIASMKSMTRAGLNQEGLLQVMEAWPVFNHHTDYTGIFNPYLGTYVSGVWLSN